MACPLPVNLEVVPAGDVPALRDELVACYRTVFAAPPWRESEGSVQWFAGQLLEYPSLPGFRLVLARGPDPAPLGFAVGVDTDAQRWWRGRVAEALRARADEWVPGSWTLAELAVLPRHRGRGLGSRLHDTVLGGLPNPTALLTTHAGAERALRLYGRRGWETLDPAFRMYRGSQPLVLMGLRRAATA